MTLRIRLGAIVIAVLVVLGIGCGRDQQPPGTAKASESGEKVLHYGNGGDPKTLDPALQSLVLEGNIMLELFECLVTRKADSSIVPGQAQSWEISDDGLTYTFHLREGLKWSDGEALTAHDFVFAFQRMQDPATAAELAFSFYALKNAEAINTGKLEASALGADAIDDHTLVLRLENPFPAFIPTLAAAYGAPIPRHAVAKFGKAWAKPGNMVSNGPYLFRDWRVGDRLEIEKNPLYRNADQVAIDRVFFYPTEDSEAALRRIRAGELHIDRNFPLARASWLRDKMPDFMHTHPYLGSYFYVFNLQRAPFDDLRVRQALNMVVDRDAVVKVVLQDLGFQPAYSLVPPTLEDWQLPDNPPWVAWQMDRRIEAASALLSEAGFGPENPLQLTISYNTDEAHKRIAIVVAKSWQPLGVVTTLENFEFRVHTDNTNQGNFDISRRGWIGVEGQPEFFLEMFESNNLPLNGGRWSNPLFDAKLNEAALLVTPAERNAVMREADNILRDELPLLPIYFYISRSLVSPSVTGWEDNAIDAHRIKWMDLVDG